MATQISTEPELTWEAPKPVFKTDYIDTPGVSYDISPDGQFLYFVKSVKQADLTRLIVVQNLFEELERLVPAGK